MLKHTLFLPLLAAALYAPAFGVEWMTDLAAAQAKAKAEKKLLLMDFTGSDWCGPCAAMRRDVLDTPAFDAYAKDKFVCLEVDVPHNKPLPPKLQEQNAKLCEQYEIRVFPTIAVTAPDGQVVGGYLGGIDTHDKMVLMLDKAVAAGKKYRKAAKQKGEKRAKNLCAVWVNIPAELRTGSAAMKEEIIRLDTNHVTGMDAELKAEEQMKAFMAEAYKVKDAEDFVKLTRRYAPIALPQNKVEIYRWHINMIHQTADSIEEVQEAGKYAELMAELDPMMTEATKADIRKTYADPAAALEKIRREREANK